MVLKHTGRFKFIKIRLLFRIYKGEHDPGRPLSLPQLQGRSQCCYQVDEHRQGWDWHRNSLAVTRTNIFILEPQTRFCIINYGRITGIEMYYLRLASCVPSQLV
jgi:hypothetical protein